MKMKLNKFCAIYSLRTGVIAIGTAHMVVSIFTLILTIIAGCVLEESPDYASGSSLFYLTKGLLAGVITYLIIVIVIIAILIVGVKERKVNYIFPYVCMNFMIVVLSIVYSISHLSLALIMPTVTPLCITGIILFNAIIISGQVYMYLVVYSFYHQEIVREKYVVGMSNTESRGEIYREKLGYHV